MRRCVICRRNTGCPAFMAICAYALDGEEPQIEGVPGAVFTLIRPNLDASMKKAESGQAAEKQANRKPRQSSGKAREN